MSWKVAGTLLTAELALKHGLACNTAGGKTRSAGGKIHFTGDYGHETQTNTSFLAMPFVQ